MVPKKTDENRDIFITPSRVIGIGCAKCGFGRNALNNPANCDCVQLKCTECQENRILCISSGKLPCAYCIGKRHCVFLWDDDMEQGA